MITRHEFLARRKSGIGGSDVAAVLGVSHWVTPYQLYLDKTTDDVRDDMSMRLEAGARLEPVIAQWVADRHPGMKIQRRNRMYRHRDFPELVADIDRYIVGGGILECKTYTGYDRDRWGKDQTADIPDEYLLQVQHYMHVTGYRETLLAVLIHGWELREYHVDYDRELAEYAAAECVKFWRKHVLTRIPPPPSERDKLEDYYTARSGATVAATPEVLELVERAKLAKVEAKKTAACADELAREVKEYMGEHEILLGPGDKPLATWKKQQARVTTAIDWEELIAEYSIDPADIERFTRKIVKTGARPLLLK